MPALKHTWAAEAEPAIIAARSNAQAIPPENVTPPAKLLNVT